MPDHMAGTELYTHTLALAQQQSGYEVAVLVPHFEHYRSGKFRGQYQYEGVNVFQYFEPSDPGDKDIVFGRKPAEGMKSFHDFLTTWQPDIVHFQELTRSIGPGLPHVKMAKQLGATVFLTMHLSGYTCNTNTLIQNGQLCKGRISPFDCTVCSYKTLFGMPAAAAVPAAMMGILSAKTGLAGKFPPGKVATVLSMPSIIQRIGADLAELVDNTDQLVSLTEWYKKILLINGVPPEKITVIPQRLANDRVIPIRQPAHPALPVKLIFIGRIQPQKGVHLLIEAAKSFTKQQLTVDIFGFEEDTDYYRECRDASVAFDHIRLMGPLDRNKVLTTMPAYDMLCLPSTFSEMSPLVIQEAFIAGIPVVASRVYGNAEQVKHGVNGLLFAPGSVNDLRRQLSRVIAEPALIGKIKSRIEPPGNFSKTAGQYDELIKTFRKIS